MRFRILDTFTALCRMLLALLRQKNIVIYDHRNPLVVIAAIICRIFPSRFKCIFIGEDGLHSLIVDKYQQKFLYWQTTSLKAFLLKKVEVEVLNFKRIHALKDMRAHSATGSLFVDYYSCLGKAQTSLIGSTIFIDAPAVMDSMDLGEISEFSAMLKTYKNVEIILHPRRQDHSFYKRLGFAARYSPDIEAELSAADKTIQVIGYFSTVLLAGKYYNHKIKALEMPMSTTAEFKEYANTGIRIIND